MSSELDKMRTGQLADVSDPLLQRKLEHCKRLLAEMRGMSTYHEGYRELLERLIPGLPATATVCPPFYCDYGDGITLGEHVFVNAGCTFLDGGCISIGAHTLVGPSVQIYTPQHPADYLARRAPKEYALPVRIGADCWIGGGVVVCPGVTIGDRCIVAAGSVVTRDIPSDCMAAGNPAVVKKHLAPVVPPQK